TCRAAQWVLPGPTEQIPQQNRISPTMRPLTHRYRHFPGALPLALHQEALPVRAKLIAPGGLGGGGIQYGVALSIRLHRSAFHDQCHGVLDRDARGEDILVTDVTIVVFSLSVQAVETFIRSQVQ